MKRLAPVLAVTALVALVLGLRLALPDALVPDALISLPPEARAWGVPLVAAAFFAATLALLPTSPIALAGGALLGPTVGFATVLGAALAGAFLAYLIGRGGARFARDLLARRAPRALRLLDAHGLRAVIAARMPPLPFGPMSYGLGIAGVAPIQFVVGTLLGVAPMVLLLVSLGAALGDATILRAPEFLVPFALALALTLVVAWRAAPADPMEAPA